MAGPAGLGLSHYVVFTILLQETNGDHFACFENRAALSKSAGAVSSGNKPLNDEQATMRGSLNDKRARQEAFLESRPLAADPPPTQADPNGITKGFAITRIKLTA